MAKMTIALAGAGGRLGHFLRSALKAAGYAVRSMNRNEHGDLSQSDFRPFLEGCSALIHAAFDHAPGKYRGGEGDDPLRFWELNFNSTLRLLEQAQEIGVQKVVLFSSRAVYGSHQVFDGPIDETVLPQPDTHYGMLKLATENLARLYSDDRMQVTVLRPTGIYGGAPEANKWTPLFQDALQGTLPQTNRTATEVHGKTVADAAIMALQNSNMADQVFNLSEVQVTTAQILANAGFDTSAMPDASPISGPILSCQRLQDLGLRLRGEEELRQSAHQLYQDLLTS